MAYFNWVYRSGIAKNRLFAFRNFVALFFVGFFYLSATNAVKNPDEQNFSQLLYPKMNASLSFNASDPIITGSISNIFSSKVFSGPNRSIKMDRQRPQNEILDFAKRFEAARTQIATLREESKALDAATIRVANINSSTTDVIKQISVGSSDVALMSAALEAIDKVDGTSQNMPAPLTISKQLAYVRANAPITSLPSPTAISVSKKQIQCLATAIYFEARGEPYRGQVGVAQVVVNRVKNKLYPSTICGVVYQNQNKRNACQFSFACDGIRDRVNEKAAWTQSVEIAKKVTNGEIYLTEVANATHYHATYVNPRWASKMDKLTQIGIHKFYRFKKGWIWS